MLHKIILICLSLFMVSSAWSDTGTNHINAYRYEISYPDNWKIHNDKNGTIVFTLPIPDTKLSVMVNIQSIYTKAGGGKYKSVKDLMDDFLIQVPMHSENAKLFDRQPFIYKLADEQPLTGEQIYLTFRRNKQTYKQWQIMLMTPDGILFQAFAYRAPQQYFDKYLPVATQMLESWVVK